MHWYAQTEDKTGLDLFENELTRLQFDWGLRWNAILTSFFAIINQGNRAKSANFDLKLWKSYFFQSQILSIVVRFMLFWSKFIFWGRSFTKKRSESNFETLKINRQRKRSQRWVRKWNLKLNKCWKLAQYEQRK
jgi:hypothetical protein